LDNIPFCTPPRWWGPLPNKWVIWFFTLGRKLRQKYYEGVSHVEIQGLEHVRQAVDHGYGILIASNHTAHADPFVFLRASDALGRYFYYMANWQSFHMLSPISQRMLQWHGCFSINREGIDMLAYEQAVEVIQTKPHPLVVFAEGQLNHHYQRVAPFRTGASLFAQAAAQGAERPVVCIPAAIVYRYTEEPFSELARLLSLFEDKLGWLPMPHLALAERVRRVGEGILDLREKRYLGQTRSGPYCERAETVLASILKPLETVRQLHPRRLDVPDRVTRLRRLAIQQRASNPLDYAGIADADHQLHDLQVAAQLYSYMHDYDTEEPTFEHLAEIVDKLEEDILGVVTATTRGRRCAYLRFGSPLPVTTGKMENLRRFTARLHANVQGLVDSLILSCGPWQTEKWSQT